MELDYIPRNPAARCVLPKARQREVKPLDDEQAAALLKAAQGGELEHLITTALFTGMRLSELLGLTWDVVDFKAGKITVNKQLVPTTARPEHGLFSTPKSGRSRILVPAPFVLDALKRQRRHQAEQQLKAGPVWNNPAGLVFTFADGSPWNQQAIEGRFKRLLAAAGLDGVHFHDLRHTYAVNSIRSGDDVKTTQGNLGHASAAFTLDRYGHVTEKMQQASAQRMEGFIKDVLNL